MARKNKADTAQAAAVEQVEKPGLNMDEGIILATFFLLVGALVFVYQANQSLI